RNTLAPSVASPALKARSYEPYTWKEQTVPKRPIPRPHDTLQADATPRRDLTPDVDAADTLEDAILDEMVTQGEVWQFINEIRERSMPQEQRHAPYHTLCLLIASRPPAERDALIAHGKEVWNYRTETVRKDVEAIRATSTAQTEVTPNVACAEF